ncbi:MAG TPA: type II toxin-antitoxin system RelE/ParE family toxin [Allosphingosinicella sp.]|nr:type II toxin-antitoxin system RelE/ParE family toxin [Allosphingosinicella sp.]
MAWTIEVSKAARKQLDALDQVARALIIAYLETRVLAEPDPRRLATRLVGEDSPNWRYRVGDYRIVVRFEDERLVILVVRVAHRREVYR